MKQPHSLASGETLAETDRWFPHVTVASIAIRDGKYLLVQERYRGTSVRNQPAGHIEQGESLEQAVIRETLEEAGWHFQPRFISGVYHFIASIDETYLRFVFSGDLIDQQLNYELDPAIENVCWMNLNEIRSAELDLRNSIVVQCLENFESGNRIPANGIQQLK